MCGICGVFRRGGAADDRAVVEGMLARLTARGPDDRGIAEEPGHPVILGNRRLAIQDLSAAGHQPMESADGRFVVTFNGEIYNPQEIRRALGVSSDALRSHSDTEVLLHAWGRHGVNALATMVGQWAFALYDRTERCLWLARDRFGEKPLFYHVDDDQLSFASTLDALLAAPWIGAEIDPELLSEYVAMRYVVSPRTILRGVKKLPPGHVLRVTTEGTTLHRWYDLPFWDGRRRRRSSEEITEEFDALLRQAVSRCRIGDVPVAIFLSDGIDSNSIRAAQKPGEEALPCFTFVAEEDRRTTRDAAAVDQGASRVVVSMAERVAEFEEALQSLTEPVGDGVAIATWQLVRRCRPRATVFLCGHGGDEIMGGYRMDQDLSRLRLLHLAARFHVPLPTRTVQRYVYGPEEVGTRVRRLRKASLHDASRAARYLIHRPLSEVDHRALFGEGESLSVRTQAVSRLYEECPAEAGPLDCMQNVMLRSFLPENLLSFSDAVGMASSAELRLPFLDRDLVDFVLRLPVSERVGARPGRQNNKVLLRRWARGHLDADVVSRRKRGFSSGSIAALLAEPSARVRERLLDAPGFRTVMPGLERWLAKPPGHFTGSREGSLWALLALAVWQEGLDRSPVPHRTERAARELHERRGMN